MSDAKEAIADREIEMRDASVMDVSAFPTTAVGVEPSAGASRTNCSHVGPRDRPSLASASISTAVLTLPAA